MIATLKQLAVSPSLRRSLRIVTVAGCLFMIYSTGTMCPAFTEFFRTIGANELHFGLLGGVPLAMLFMQFVGAALTNRIRRRKGLFMFSIITARLLFLPMVFIPLLLPEGRRTGGIWVALTLYAISGGLLNIGGPPWFSWMADMTPRRVLSRFFGFRHRAMFITWTASYLLVAVLSWLSPWPITVFYPVLATFAVIAGVMDIALFAWVHEPPNTITRGRPALDVLLDPIRHHEFRTFLVFSCAWHAAAMFAAAFMQLYILKILGLSIWQATLIWSVLGIGNALAAKRIGRVADRHGHRAILSLCVSLKSLIVFAFLLITRRTAVWVLPVAFLLDSMLNAGLIVCSGGYMMKMAPRQNRSMFVASVTGFAGLCGGLSAMLAGWVLKLIPDVPVHFLGRDWIDYHLIFACSALMRIACVFLARRIREPKSTGHREVLFELIGVWPLRFVRYPIGLYRRGVSLLQNQSEDVPLT
jgi:MFS family permease